MTSRGAWRRLSAAALVGAVAALIAAPTAGYAHVEVDNGSTPAKGGDGVVRLTVPTESDTASTIGLAVTIPADVALSSARVLPVAGWSAKVESADGRVTRIVAAHGGTVPPVSVRRATVFPTFHVHLNAPWHATTVDNGRAWVKATDGTHVFDFVIAGTGYQQNPHTRPELAAVADRIALWRDVYRPPAELSSDHLGSFPYVGAGYQLTPRQGADDAWVGNIHAFNVGASQSFGRPVGDVPSLHAGVPRLVDAIVGDLVLADLHRPKAPANGAKPTRALSPETV